MSQGSFRRPPQFPRDEPLVAEVVGAKPCSNNAPFAHEPSPGGPPKPSNAWFKPLLGCGLVFFTVLLLIAGGAFIFYRTASQLSTNASTQSVTVNRPLVEERETLTAALDGAWHERAGDPKHRDVRKLLKNLEEAHAAHNTSTFAGLVNWPAHMERYYKAFRFQPLTRQQRNQLDTLEQNDFTMPPGASNFKIASIEPRTADDWYLYTYAQEGSHANAAYLFHVRRAEGVWKLVDWADVADLHWTSELQGLGAGPIRTDTARTEQNQLVEELNEADKLNKQGEIENAVKLIRRAEARSGIPALQNSNCYLIALRWHAQRNLQETERMLAQANNPDGYPWIHFLVALVHYERGEFDPALASISRFEQCAGFHREMALLKTHCHAQLKQNDLAARSALSLVRYAPEDREALSLALQYVPAGQLTQLFALLPNSPETAEKIAQSSSALLYRDDVTSFQQIRGFLAQKYPASEQALALDAQLLHYQGELEQALAAYTKLSARHSDPAKSRQTRNRALSLSLEFKTPLASYREATNARETLAAMTNGIADDESLITIAQLKQILPLHRQRDPQDPQLSWYAAQVALHDQDWSTAVLEITTALAALPAPAAAAAADPDSDDADDADDADSPREELNRQLLSARYSLGEGLAAYLEAKDHATAYRALASLMEDHHDWEALEQLHQLHPDEPDDLWRRYYVLRAQEVAARKAHDPRQLRNLLTSYEALAKANAEPKTVYPFLLENRLDSLYAAGNTWKSHLAAHPEAAHMLPHLATRFRREKNPAALQELIAFARQNCPQANELEQLELDQLWERKNYTGVVNFCSSHTLAASASRRYGIDRIRQERLVLSLLMLGDTAEAWKAASEPAENVSLQWLVRLAAGEPAAIRTFLTEHRDQLYSALSFSDDALRVPALTKFLASPEFRQLRTEFALPLNNEAFATRALLFFPAGQAWSEDTIRTRLREAGLANVAVQKLTQPPAVTGTYRLHTPSATCFLTCGSAPYATTADLGQYSQHWDPSLKTVLAAHQQWLALELEPPASEAADNTWLKMVAAFTPNALALASTLPGEGTVQLAITPAVAKQLAANPESLTTFSGDDESSVWIPSSANSDETEHPFWYARCRAVAQGAKPGRVQIRLTRGHATETHWITVVSVTHAHWGNYTIDAKLQKSSELNPLFAAGDLLRVPSGVILAWEE